MAEGPNVWEALVLAIIQGVTEWLPVSSSGHLVLADELLGIQGTVGYILLLHAGTLVAVIWFYRLRLWSMLRSLATLGADVRAAEGFTSGFTRNPDRMLALWVVVATIPIIVAALVFRSYVETSHESLGTLWFDFLLTAAILARASMVRRADRPVGTMRTLDAIVIGIYQAVALLPGVSRSGATIAGGVERKFSWSASADFAFLLSIPALAGAMVLEWREFQALAQLGWAVSIVGFVVSAVVGYLTIRFLLAFLRRTRPWVFAAYCAGLGFGLLFAWL